jgi:hypothetical protein
VGHEPLRTLLSLGDSQWAFMRKAFESPVAQPVSK